MENNVTNTNQEVKDNIRKKVLGIEKSNYAQKPDGGKTDREMIDLIKKIIETEVKKWLLRAWL